MKTNRVLRLGIVVLCLSAGPVWCQVEPAAEGGNSMDDTIMMIPPPVSGISYPIVVGAEERPNVVGGGVLFTVAHDDNVLVGQTSRPVSDFEYIIWPNIELVERTPRLRLSGIYGAGFSFYDPTSVLNSITQNGDASIQYRVTPHIVAGLQDSFQHDNNPFTQPYVLSGTGVSGAPTGRLANVIVPYASSVTDTTQGEIGYQFARNAMIGAGGDFSISKYGKSSQAGGLFNGHVHGGDGFYVRRVSADQYLGLKYVYSDARTEGVVTTTNSHEVSAFYTLYFSRTVSLSAAAGYEHYASTQPGKQNVGGAEPSGSASIGWQKERTSFAITYAHLVDAAQGLLGVFRSDEAQASARWLATHRWSMELTGQYANLTSLTPKLVLPISGGHSILGKVATEYAISEHLNVEGEYGRIQERYAGVPILAAAPDSNRFSASIQYRFSRPIGQ